MRPPDAKHPTPPPDRPADAPLPLEPQAVVREAIAAFRRGELAEAERLCRAVLAVRADQLDALHLLGVVAARSDRLPEAIELLARAASVDPANPDVCISRGNVLRDLGRHAEALASYERAIALRPDYAEAHNNRGNMLRRLRRHAEALASYERALALKPDYADAHSNRGNALADLRRHAEALAAYERALVLRPGYADAWSNRGNALRDLRRYPEALESYARAIALDPRHADAHFNRGVALGELKRHAEALDSYTQALQIDPGFPFLYGIWLRARMRVCDWTDFSEHLDRLTARIERSEKASSPFAVLALSGSPAIQRKAAEIWVRDRYWPAEPVERSPRATRHDRIRVGYFSADFRAHPVSFLTAELIERHDRSRFEAIAFSYGPDVDDDMRRRLVASFDRFLDVRGRTDEGIARLARELAVDIAVDLGGHTGESRPGIFARRAAPLQVSYLGYLGTMGADFIDYLIADRTLVPEEHRRHYAEKIVCLPSYQASDTRRRIADRTFTRGELGLPQSGFIYCCFNNSYKIVPAIFDRWMAALRQVERSVLFLYAENAWVEVNLRREAAARGVDPARLVFGSRLPMAEYLARYRAADLFLDTSPYNAGATASDALWAGLPVLTFLGETFAGRMGASLLRAIDLHELVAETPARYEQLAVELATQPDRMQTLRRKLAAHRLATPLFDMPRFTRHLETAYAAMHERQLAGLPPEHIDVTA